MVFLLRSLSKGKSQEDDFHAAELILHSCFLFPCENYRNSTWLERIWLQSMWLCFLALAGHKINSLPLNALTQKRIHFLLSSHFMTERLFVHVPPCSAKASWLRHEEQRVQTSCDNRVLLFIQGLSALAQWLARLMSPCNMSAGAHSPLAEHPRVTASLNLLA